MGSHDNTAYKLKLVQVKASFLQGSILVQVSNFLQVMHYFSQYSIILQ